ncbi:ER-derived vesicles protein erv46, partial [Coemansia sp. RSA 637]
MGRAHTLRQRFQSLDAYAKTLDDFSIKTLTGGVLTVATALLIAVLVGLEFAAYRRVEQSAELVVDRSRSEKMLINLDITLPHAPCVLLGLDVLDSSGDTQINLFQHVTKMRLTSNGTEIGAYSTKAKAAVPPPSTNADGAAYCGSCYGGIEPEGG